MKLATTFPSECVQFGRRQNTFATNRMANGKKRNRQRTPLSNSTVSQRRGLLWLVSATIGLTILVWAGFQMGKNRAPVSAEKLSSASASALTPAKRSEITPPLNEALAPKSREQRISTSPSQWSTNQNLVAASLATLEVAQAAMVTVELDFGPKVPSIAAALVDIERHSQPEDGKGRTFAVLDAYGEPTPSGKLHLSMHVSAEKPGVASLIFTRTAEILWSRRIIPSTDSTKRQFTGKKLSIFIDDGTGKLLTIDGSNNPTWIMDAVVREKGALLDTVWPSGVEHEVTFIYSACGCPVKVMARREGDQVVRTKELPVMFPDDPAAVELIGKLMRW